MDGFEITCDNRGNVRVAFALDCCDCESLGHVATTEGLKRQNIQDLTIVAVEYHFDLIGRLPIASNSLGTMVPVTLLPIPKVDKKTLS